MGHVVVERILQPTYYCFYCCAMLFLIVEMLQPLMKSSQTLVVDTISTWYSMWVCLNWIPVPGSHSSQVMSEYTAPSKGKVSGATMGQGAKQPMHQDCPHEILE